MKEETRGTSELSDESGDETKAVLRRTPENKEDDLRTALREALMSNSPEKVLVIGTMKNKKSCPKPTGLEFKDERSLSTAKTLPSSMKVLIFLTSINHKSVWKMEGKVSEEVTVFSQVSGNQLRRMLNDLGYKEEPIPKPTDPVLTPSAISSVLICTKSTCKQFGVKRILWVIKANQNVFKDQDTEQATKTILDLISKLGGKANPKAVRDTIEKYRTDADTNVLLDAICPDQELEQLFKNLDCTLAKLKQRYRKVATERNEFELKLLRVSD